MSAPYPPPTMEQLAKARELASLKLLVQSLIADDYGISEENKNQLVAYGKAHGKPQIRRFLAQGGPNKDRYFCRDNAGLREYMGL